MNRAEALGHITSLMLTSEVHCAWRLGEFNTYVVPLINKNQFKLYMNSQGRCLGFATWAWLSQSAAYRFKNYLPLEPADLISDGSELWFIDFVAPFGNVYPIVRDLKKHIAQITGDAKPHAKTRRMKQAGAVKRIGFYGPLVEE